MTLEEFHQFIETQLDAVDVTPFKLVFENITEVDLDDAGRPKLFYGDTPFITTEVKITESRRLEINPGSPSREDGVIILDIHVPKGKGTRAVFNLLDKLDAVFLNKTVNEVYFNKRVNIGDYQIGKWAVFSYQYRFMFCL